MLFSTAVFLLVWKSKSFARWILLASAVIMFTVITVGVGLSMYILLGVLNHARPPPPAAVKTKHMFTLITK